MIFATTGTQLAFPRLISTLDRLAPTLNEPILAQVGPDPGPYGNLKVVKHLDPAAYDRTITEARVLIAHAGIGTILTAQRRGKPLIVLPRRHDKGEHRNDHQLATARHVTNVPGIYIVWEEGDLENLLRRPALPPARPRESHPNLDRLTGFLSHWINREAP